MPSVGHGVGDRPNRKISKVGEEMGGLSMSSSRVIHGSKQETLEYRQNCFQNSRSTAKSVGIKRKGGQGTLSDPPEKGLDGDCGRKKFHTGGGTEIVVLPTIARLGPWKYYLGGDGPAKRPGTRRGIQGKRTPALAAKTFDLQFQQAGGNCTGGSNVGDFATATVLSQGKGEGKKVSLIGGGPFRGKPEGGTRPIHVEGLTPPAGKKKGPIHHTGFPPGALARLGRPICSCDL